MKAGEGGDYLRPVHGLLAALFGFSIYLSALGGGFVWDDSKFILGDERAGGLGSALVSFLRPCGWAVAGEPCSIYRPLRTLSYALDSKLWGPGPFGYHMTSALLHALSSALVYLASAQMLGGRGGGALFGALVFASHPVHTEAVAWASGRAELLGALFSFLSFFFHLRGQRSASLLSFSLALLSKETSLALVGVLGAHGLLFGPRRRFFGDLAKPLLPYFAIGLAYYLIRLYALGQATSYGYFAGGYYPTVLTQLRSFGHYLKLGFFPTWLLSDYIAMMPSSSILEARVLASLALVCLLVAGVLYCRSRLVLFCLLWWSFFLLPSSSLILPINYFLAERWLYTPSFGFSLFCGLLFLHARSRWPHLAPGYLALGLATLLLFTIGASHRNLTWRNSLSLWSDVVKKSPGNYVARNNLAVVFGKAGNYDKAGAQLFEALKTRHSYLEAKSNLGSVYLGIKHMDRAIVLYKEVLFLRPDFEDARAGLRRTNYLRGQKVSAE